jgi:hypothetical protein
MGGSCHRDEHERCHLALSCRQWPVVSGLSPPALAAGTLAGAAGPQESTPRGWRALQLDIGYLLPVVPRVQFEKLGMTEAGGRLGVQGLIPAATEVRLCQRYPGGGN